MELRDRVGIVVGAGSVLGATVAAGLAGEGMTLELVDLPGRGVVELASQLQQASDVPVVSREVDLRSDAAVAEALDRALREYGRVDLIVDIVALPRTPLVVRDAQDAWDEVVEGTFRGAYTVCREGVRRMLPRQQGQIILLCPCAGSSEAYQGALAVAVREGLAAMCSELRHEVRRDGIRVDCIRHGPVEAPPVPRRDGVVERLVRPEEVARALLWLATTEPDVRVGDLSLFAHEG